MFAGMSKSIRTFRDVIDLWPEAEKPNGRASKPMARRYGSSIQAFADDIGIPYARAQLMHHRNSVNAKYWQKMIDKARERGIRGVTLKRLSELYEARRERAA